MIIQFDERVSVRSALPELTEKYDIVMQKHNGFCIEKAHMAHTLQWFLLSVKFFIYFELLDKLTNR